MEKTLDKIQLSFMIETLSKLRVEGNVLSLIKTSICKILQLTADGENGNLLAKSGVEQGCPLSTLLLSMVESTG